MCGKFLPVVHGSCMVLFIVDEEGPDLSGKFLPGYHSNW